MDYSQQAFLYSHRQGEFHERLAYGPTSPGSYGQRYPVVDSHMVGGLENYEPKPRWSSHHNYWQQVPLSNDYSGHHRERPGRGMYHQTQAGRPWSGPEPERPGYFPQPANWRPRAQYHPRPRSARFRVSNPYAPDHGIPNCWTNVYGRGRHVEPDLEGLPRAQTTTFDTNTIPRSQHNQHHNANLNQGVNEQFMSQQEYMPQADGRPGLSPGDYHSRCFYTQHSPEHTRTGHRSYHGVLDPAFIFGAETTGQGYGHRNHGISDKNHKTTSSEQQRPYRRPSSTRFNRSFATKGASYGSHNVPITSTENIASQKRPTQQHNCRSERVNKSYPKVPLGRSNNTAAAPQPGNPSSPHQASRFQSFYVGDSFEQSRRRSESSDDTDTREGCFATHDSRHKGESDHHRLPYRTRSTSKELRQELHRCALAAAALQLERSELRREWMKLRRGQETLLHGQRRLRHDWQNWKGKQQQHPSRHDDDDSESMDPCIETESSSRSDYAEPAPHKSQHRRAEDSGAGCFRPCTASEQTNHDPRRLLDQYNRQWATLLSGHSTDIAWPTADLKAATLSNPTFRTPRPLLNRANPQDLLKWNVFNFFTSAFGSRATVEQTTNGIVMDVSSTTSLEVAKAIRNQAREDIKRWHQDKLACRDGELASDEGAKAVFAAVFELYGACSERVRMSCMQG